MPGHVVISSIDDVTYATVRNTSLLDGLDLQDLASQLNPLVEEQALKKLLLDFSKVQFISSSVIGLLLSLQKKSKAIGGKVVICGLRPKVQKVFEVAGLDKILLLAKSESDGIRMFPKNRRR